MVDKKFGAILIPDWLGNVDEMGVALGPKVLYNTVIKSKKLIFGEPIAAYITDCVEIPFLEPKRVDYLSSTRAKYFSEIDTIQLRICDEIKAMINCRKIPIIFLGDDSSLVGTISGFISVYGSQNLGVLYCDAHADLNTPDTTRTGKVYGMPLGFLMHLQGHTMKCNEVLQPLTGRNIYMLGQRAFDPIELPLILDLEIPHASSDEINSSNYLADDIVDYFKYNGIENLFLHVDADVIDPAENPGVVIPENYGANLSNLLRILWDVALMTNVAGLSISEFVPRLDVDCKTRNNMAMIVESVIESIVSRRV